jgi:hypothetical protein
MKQERIPIKNLETHITKFTSINNLLRKIWWQKNSHTLF